LNKWLPAIAFSVLLLAPIGAQNAFAGSPVVIIDSTGDGAGNPLIGAHGVAGDSAGNVYVAGNISDNVFRIATPGTCSTGGTSCTITEIIDSEGDCTVNFIKPQDITVDSIDNVYASTFSDNVFKLELGMATSTLPFSCPIVIGGTVLLIDSTALLLANTQSFSWMIPVVLSVLGIGLFAVSRKSENS